MDSVGLSARTKECGQCREVKIRVNIWTMSDSLPGPKIYGQCREVKIRVKYEYMHSVGLSGRTKECGQCREVKIRVNIWTVSDCLPGPKSVANVERLK